MSILNSIDHFIWEARENLLFRRNLENSDFKWTLECVTGRLTRTGRTTLFRFDAEQSLLRLDIEDGDHRGFVVGSQKEAWKLTTVDWLVRESAQQFRVEDVVIRISPSRSRGFSTFEYLKLAVGDTLTSVVDEAALVEALMLALKEVVHWSDWPVSELWVTEYSRVDFLRRMCFEHVKAPPTLVGRQRAGLGSRWRLQLASMHWLEYSDLLRVRTAERAKRTRSVEINKRRELTTWKL